MHAVSRPILRRESPPPITDFKVLRSRMLFRYLLLFRKLLKAFLGIEHRPMRLFELALAGV